MPINMGTNFELSWLITSRSLGLRLGQVGFTANCNLTRYFLGKNPTQAVYLGLRFGGNQVLALQKNWPTAAFFLGALQNRRNKEAYTSAFQNC